MLGRTLCLAALLVAACASTPDPEPVLPGEIVVSPLEEGRLYGGQAVYVVDAPRDVMEAVVLDFDGQAAYRPTILEARGLTAGPNGGTVRFKFRGSLGVDPEAECVYTIVEEDGGWALDYRMVDSSMVLWGLSGGFRLRSVKDGAATLVAQRFLVSALAVNRTELLNEFRRDALAIKRHAEDLARGVARDAED